MARRKSRTRLVLARSDGDPSPAARDSPRDAEEILALLRDPKFDLKILNGTRVVCLAGPPGAPCDHEGEHNESWKAATAQGDCVEAGTIESLIRVSDRPDGILSVRWDCGQLKYYSLMLGEWEQLRVLHLAATGKLETASLDSVRQLQSSLGHNPSMKYKAFSYT